MEFGMESKQMFSTENFFGKYERIIRGEIGKELDNFRQLIGQIENRCTVRIMNVDFSRPNKGTPITVDNLISCDRDFRCKTLAALLYNDALWRLEATYLMICIGLLNVAYANLRTSLEALLTAFIVERCDEEALRFLKNEKVNPKLAERFINPQYDKILKAMKHAYGVWGVHTYFESLQLSSLFGASRFDKYVTESTKIQKALQLPEGFIEAAKTCIQQGGQVGILFSWLESIPAKG
jgi:hypothetical protein